MVGDRVVVPADRVMPEAVKRTIASWYGEEDGSATTLTGAMAITEEVSQSRLEEHAPPSC